MYSFRFQRYTICAFYHYAQTYSNKFYILEVSSLSLDILVDVLDHFLESFFKLLKNLRNVHQVDLTEPEELIKNNYYSTQPYLEQALIESGIGTIQEIKDFYINDIINYYRQTYKKVSKMYDEYRAKKLDEKNKARNKNENDLKLEEFMKENDLYNFIFLYILCHN